MAPKRRDFATAAPPGKRARGAAAPGTGTSSEPPPSPGTRLRAAARTVLVVLFLIRGKDSSVDSLARIGRVLRAIWSKLECMDKRIQDLTQNVDNITRSSPTHHNHQRLVQEANQEGTSAEAQGLAATKGEVKNTSIRLRFLNGMKSPIYHDDDIKSKSNAAIKIGIFDGDKMIKLGSLSKLKIEILALEGNFPYGASDSWTAKEFNEHRASGRDGKENVLAGKGTTVQLINGECDLGSIRFREGSCKARNGMFIIGARVCEGQRTGVRIHEAVMNPVVVQDRRNKSNEKSHPPKLNDRVHRLEEIAKDGKYCKRLEKEKILTVEHFLKALNKDPDDLARVLQIKKERKAWEKMVKHAQDCCLEGKHELKSYRCAERNMALFFNCVHRLVGASFGGYYTASDKFDPAQQVIVDKLKKNAYDQLDRLIDDHVMIDNFPVPIFMDRNASAGPYCMSSATQQNLSGHLAAHQVVIEGLRHAQTEPFHANAKNAPAPSSSIPVGGIPAVAVDDLSHVQTEPSCESAKNDPGSSSSVPDLCSTQNYRDQVTQLADQEPNDLWQGLKDFLGYEDDGLTHLLYQPDTIIWPGSDTLEASTSAHNNMTLTRQQLTTPGAPGSAQGSIQREIQAPSPNNGASEASASAQQDLPPQQWSQCQGNLLGNGAS